MQNRSSAVMQQRIEAADSLDDFPTPPWATRALCEFLMKRHNLPALECREPAANRGFMSRTLWEYFGHVRESDIYDYGAGFPMRDYLTGWEPRVDWTITNPPFRLAPQFIARAMESSAKGCAVIVRSAFLEGVGRYLDLFSMTPPTDVLQFSERVPMLRGRYDPKGSTATAYLWLVWDKAALDDGTRLQWIAPCRRQLERPGDFQLVATPQNPQTGE
jgi:hypothetical protein